MNLKEALPTGKAFDLHHSDSDGALNVFTETWGHFIEDMQIVHGTDTSFLEGDVMERKKNPSGPENATHGPISEPGRSGDSSAR
jgi:hypothetical protein